MRINDLEQVHATLTEQTAMLSRAVASREGAYDRAQEKIQAQSELVQLLENQLRAARDGSELQLEEMNAQLQRERLERTMAEGALEAGRKDIARLLRELAAMQYRPLPAEATGEAPAARRLQNAA